MSEINKIEIDGIEYDIAGGGAEVIVENDNLIINNNGGGSSDKNHTYSTEEQIIGTWIDGKPVYEKTYYNAAPVMSSNHENFINIDTIENYKQLIDVQGNITRVVSSELEFAYSVNTVEKNTEYLFLVRMQQNILQYIGYFNKESVKNLIITIQYTKTTD